MEPSYPPPFTGDESDQEEEEESEEEQSIECEHCGCIDLQKLVSCSSSGCARLNRIFCRYCLECGEPSPCGKDGHSSCWDKHLPSKKLSKFKTHIQRPVVDGGRLENVFRAATEYHEQVKLHAKDRTARWFIVQKAITDKEDDYNIAADSYGTLVWTNRFQYLNSQDDSHWEPDTEQFPCLVSFIGKTGVGKSTLIRGLITLSKNVQKTDLETLETPVTRIRNLAQATQPTSAGVNLYRDPDTIGHSHPIFFADCEGFGAGAAPPGAAAVSGPYGDDPQPSEVQITSSLYSNSANGDGGEDSRSEAVSNLYARFLYSFSDVVCFVMNEMQSFAAEIERLLLFITKGFETALNQTPSKTLIFIFNQINDHWAAMMDPEKLKRKVFTDIHNVWVNSKSLAGIRQRKWAKEINTTEEFLGKYFQKIQFCYIPRRGNVRLEVIGDQYALLRRQISDASRFAADDRKGTWAHYNTEDLTNLFELAFNHFATQAGPFNFALAARKHNENPVNMEGHIMCLLKQAQSGSNLYVTYDFSKLVASAFVNHCLPRGEGIIITSPEALWSELYEKKCSGISLFYRRCQSCQFTNETGQCALLSDFHRDIHQDSQGREIGLGVFELGELGDISAQVKVEVKYRFLQQYRKVCQDDGTKISNPRPSAAQVLSHRTNVLAQLRPGWSKIHSYKTCFTCLRSLPDHVLPCGHALCETCVIDFGERSGNSYQTEIVLRKCPLCRESWDPPQIVQTKPACAGVRVLTLDGGGIRGIIELTLWQLVEKEIGLDLPIHRFFDLIIGTSTGGIIALGMVMKQLNSADMVERFIKISKATFQYLRGVEVLNNIAGTVYSNLARTKISVQDLTTAVGVLCGPTGCAMAATFLLSVFAGNILTRKSLYRTAPLREQLQNVLGKDNSMFGNSRSTKTQRLTRVAVMTVKNGGKQATTIANYNRRHVGGQWGDFERGDTEEDELKTWEAGLCTSSTPPCFRPFSHERTGTIYLDGGLLHNNPVHWALMEYKKIWVSPNDQHERPDAPQVMLDILVSIGTGHCPDKTETHKEDPIWAPLNVVWNQLDGEEAWRKFKDSETYNSKTHHRLNVVIDRPCRLDQYDRIPDLLEQLDLADGSQVSGTEYTGALLRAKVQEVSRLLIAKLFFFQPITIVPETIIGEKRSPAKIEGKILCRLGKNEKALKTLIERIDRFVVKERENAQDGRQLKLGKKARNPVRDGSGFEIPLTIEQIHAGPPIQILVQIKDIRGSKSPPVLISGFPRKFEDLRAMYNLGQLRYRHP